MNTSIFTMDSTNARSLRRHARSGIQWLGVLLLTATLIFASTATFAAIPASERTALQNLYAYAEGDLWANKTNWNGPIGTECTWYGVTCNAPGDTVIAIDMTANNVIGTLPSLDALPDLQTLKFVSVSFIINFLYGQIPSLQKLKNLQDVEFSSGSLSGPLPDLTGLSQLTHFDAHANGLNSSISSLQGLNNLNYFDVSYNNLTGNLPSLNGLSQLQYFNVDANSFSGNIPSLSGLNQLQQFYAYINQLSGDVPDLSGLNQLINFHVEQNRLDGILPTTIANLPNLQTFSVYENFLTGTVPTLSGVPQLQNFWVALNQLSGTVSMPPANSNLKEWLCPNSLTPASNPFTAIDTALNLVTGFTPWSLYCTQTPVAANIGGVNYIDPTTADGKTVTIKAWVYGLHPTGTVTFSMSSESLGPNPITVCDSVPLIDNVASCTANALPGVGTASGTYMIWPGFSASYSGDANNAPSVNGVPWITQVSYYLLQLAGNQNSIQTGQPVDLVANLIGYTPLASGSSYYSLTDNDTLTFYEGDTILCAHVPVHIQAPPQTPGGIINTAPQMTAHCVTQFSTAGNHSIAVKNDNLLAVGQPSAPVTQTVVSPPTPGFSADQFVLTGSWYNPYTTGQGLLLEVYPDFNGTPGVGQLGAGWFTYDALGNPQWYTLQGPLTAIYGTTYALNIYGTTGGNFNATPIANAMPLGTATLTFYDCTDASLTYQFNDGRSGTIPETRLTSPQVSCLDNGNGTSPIFLPYMPANYPDVFYSGAWYDPNTSGQGLFFDVSPSTTFIVPPATSAAPSVISAAWYTYAPQAEGQMGAQSQRWFTIQGTFSETDPGNLSATQLPIYATIGGLFNAPTRTALLPVGTADINFISCNTMTLTYTFTAGEFKGLSGTLNERAVGPVSTQCPGPISP